LIEFVFSEVIVKIGKCARLKSCAFAYFVATLINIIGLL